MLDINTSLVKGRQHLAIVKHEPTKQKTILIVDDAPGIRLSIKAYLEPEGYTVLQAADAETALTLFKKEHVDLVILDMMLPGNVMGNDLLHQLRRRRATSAVPMIIISALSAFEDGLRTIDEDITFLQKPFDKEKLMPLIDAALSAQVMVEQP
jgi:DNA-binding response OmpR family regulator